MSTAEAIAELARQKFGIPTPQSVVNFLRVPVLFGLEVILVLAKKAQDSGIDPFEGLDHDDPNLVSGWEGLQRYDSLVKEGK